MEYPASAAVPRIVTMKLYAAEHIRWDELLESEFPYTVGIIKKTTRMVLQQKASAANAGKVDLRHHPPPIRLRGGGVESERNTGPKSISDDFID